MTGFTYRNGVLHADRVALPDIARTAGTPTYVYSASTIQANYRAYAEALAGERVAIHYALKANGNLAVVALLAGLGAGADIVSRGELVRALKAGIAPDRIVFSGVGKSPEDSAAAVEAGIGQINVESDAELDLIDQAARAAGRRQAVVLRVNPDIDALTHEKISTGKRGDKFGIPYDAAPSVYARAARLEAVRPVGVAVHIGSQLTDLSPFRAAYAKMADLVRALRGRGLPVEAIDLGGGLGITYQDETPPPLADYAALIRDTVGSLGCRLAIEPGRSIVGTAGLLLARALYRKPAGGRDILIVDAGMNDLMRPSLYGAYHPILPVRQAAPDAKLAPLDVVGPVCESGDIFARGRDLPPIDEGDLIAIGVAGAYSASMASTYNARPLAAEILVSGDRYEIVRRRQTIEALFADERIPDWDSPRREANC